MTQPAAKPRPLHDYPHLEAGGSILSHYGLDSGQYNALSWLADDTVVAASGKFLLFIDVRTGRVESQEGPPDGGIGAVAVHPSRRYFVVGQRSPDGPALLVHDAVTRQQVGRFNGTGATVGYAACCFDRDGIRVATVASAPDYTLAVWDWETRVMALRSKCFSSDVYTVCFSAFDNSLLVTGGSGHIKFWTMAETFTGLKLQGTLGKFGRLDISNIAGFAVLPDGKVLSGSESGCLLMWEAELVKCGFVRSLADGADPAIPCHDGAISVVRLVHDAKIVVTFGDDGWIRYWSREELDGAEGEGLPALYAPRCLAEVCVAPGSELRSVTVSMVEGSAAASQATPRWVILDTHGTVRTSALPSLAELLSGSVDTESAATELEPVRFNGGALTCCAASPTAHVVVTGGEDGFVRVVDYLTGTQQASIAWPPAARGAELDGVEGAMGQQHPAHPRAASASVTTVTFFRGDATHSHVLAGFADGTVRLLQLQGNPAGPLRLSMLGQWKPHTSDLFATVVDRTDRHVCTVARDGTVFFFHVDPSFTRLEPLGFCRLPLPEPTCAEWDEHGGGCLVGFAGGQVLAVRAPAPGSVDHTISYEFPCSFALVGIRQRKLPPPTPEDETAPEEVPGEILEEPDNGPWPITLLRGLPDGGVAIGMRKAELLYRYETTVRYEGALQLPPLPPTGVEPPNYAEDPGVNLCYRDRVPTAAYLGCTGGELLVLCEGAQVLLRTAANPAALCAAAARVSLVVPAHDSTRGYVTGAQLSYDGAMLVTTGTDGLLVAQLLAGHSAPTGAETRPPAATTTAPTHTPEPVAVPEAVTPPVLSIQQQKEADDGARARAEAEERRERFLTRALDIQERYAMLMESHAQLPTDAQLPAEATRLDSTLEGRLAAERERRVAAARQEYAVDSAREALRAGKLRRRFLDNLLHDRFVVHAFGGGFSVPSFRTADPSEAIARLRAEIAALEASDGSGSDADEAAVDGKRKGEARKSTEEAGRTETTAPGSTVISAGGLRWGSGDSQGGPPLKMNSTVTQQLQRADERREERQTRRAGYTALLDTAPDPAEDDAALAAMASRDLAERGECVPRTDPLYKGRREFRPTAAAKLNRMIALEEALVARRSAFNERLLRAREKKRCVLAELNRARERVRAIDAALGESVAGTEPLAMQSDEEPEKAFVVDRPALDAFAKRREVEKMREEEAKKAQRGFGADLAEAPGTQRKSSLGSKATLDADGTTSSRRGTVRARADSRSKSSRNMSRLTGSSRQSTLHVTAMSRERAEQELRAKLESIKPSAMEEEELAMRREQLLSERRRLTKQTAEVMERFDSELYDLLRSHSDVDADLCLGDAHLLLFFREYQMLLVFRDRDRELREQLHTTKANRVATRKELQTLQARLKENEAAVAALQDRLRTHKRDAEAYIQENAPADRAVYLTKIFNRHIKRRRHDDDNEDDDDVTSDDDEDDLDDGDSDIGEELCPPNCAPEVWERVLALRETRLDISDDIAARRKRQEEGGKQLERGNAAVVEIESSVKDCLERIAQLESEKRRQLNLLSTVVPLSCRQVKCLEPSGTVPTSLWTQSVVAVANEELQRLAGRVVDLAAQKEERRGEVNGMAAELQRLQAEKADVLRVHAQWESQVHEVMMLKFGRHVDLEMLEACGSSRRVEERREELRRVELRWDREVRKRENQIAALRDELQAGLLRNTHLLQDLGDYEGERQDAERTLSKASATTLGKYRGATVATAAARANLRELIAAQQEEMYALNAEILMLGRKGGHAYSPAGPY